MGLEEVRKEILAGARTAAKKILSEADKEISELTLASDGRLKQKEEQLKAEAKKIVDEYSLRSNAETASVIRKEKLMMEKKLVEEVFEDAEKKLVSLSAKKRQEMLAKMIEKASKKFSFQTLYCSKEDQKFLAKRNAQVTDILGGAVLESADANIRIDLSYESLLESVKERSLAEISKTLF